MKDHAGDCRHCGRHQQYLRPRLLCSVCYQKVHVRELYPADTRHQPKLDKLPYLNVLKTYPDHQKLRRCEHGVWEDACSECERAQRRHMVFVEVLVSKDDFFVGNRL